MNIIKPLLAASLLVSCTVAAGEDNKAGSELISEKTLSSLQFGSYAVGTKIIFAKDEAQRFDPWNTAYASDEYRKLLREVERSGQGRTIATSLWYPAEAKAERVQLNSRARMPYAATSGTQASFSDYVLGDPAMYPVIAGLFSEDTHYIKNKSALSLNELMQKSGSNAFERFAREAVSQKRGAFLNAPVAGGRFPLVILSHGLGGNYAMWDRAGEYLASHGYIVAAPTFISDGIAPMVFHDPASEFAKSHSQQELIKAYQTLAEPKVVPNFVKFLFGVEVTSPEMLQSFNPAEHTILPDGPEKMTNMQRNLFRQRVSDVNTVKKALEVLNLEKDICLVKASGSLTESCGLLTGHVDTEKVGLSGHSLGSMTSQLGLEHIPGVATAIGLNNGVPYSWTPQEMFGSGTTKDGLPVGNQKPLLQLIGNEDAFVQFIFYTLSQQAVTLAKGSADSIMQLETEREKITSKNPQPVALSAYKRATADKMLVTIKDVNHGILTQHESAFNFPEYLQKQGEHEFSNDMHRTRKAADKNLTTFGFKGEEFKLQDWQITDEGQWFYAPHLIRDYYYLNWFNRYLKGSSEAQKALTDNPFNQLISVRSDLK